MLEVTESALNYLKDYMHQEKIDSAIRVTTTLGGCGGSTLKLALDEPKTNDKSFDHTGINFVVEESLHAICGTIKVDYIEKSDDACGCGSDGGFAVTSERYPSGSGDSRSCRSGSCD